MGAPRLKSLMAAKSAFHGRSRGCMRGGSCDVPYTMSYEDALMRLLPFVTGAEVAAPASN